MSLILTEDYKTVEELRAAPDAILQQVEQSGRPVVLTDQGKPAVVLLAANHYEQLIHTLNLTRMLAEGERDIRAGRTRPAEEFFDELLEENRRAKNPSS